MTPQPAPLVQGPWKTPEVDLFSEINYTEHNMRKGYSSEESRPMKASNGQKLGNINICNGNVYLEFDNPREIASLLSLGPSDEIQIGEYKMSADGFRRNVLQPHEGRKEPMIYIRERYFAD